MIVANLYCKPIRARVRVSNASDISNDFVVYIRVLRTIVYCTGVRGDKFFKWEKFP